MSRPIPESMAVYFEMNDVSEEDRQRVMKSWTDTGYAEHCGRAWGEKGKGEVTE